MSFMNLKTRFVETCTIDDVLVMTRGNQTQAAKWVQCNRGTLRKVLKQNVPHLVEVTRNPVTKEIDELRLMT